MIPVSADTVTRVSPCRSRTAMRRSARVLSPRRSPGAGLPFLFFFRGAVFFLGVLFLLLVVALRRPVFLDFVFLAAMRAPWLGGEPRVWWSRLMRTLGREGRRSRTVASKAGGLTPFPARFAIGGPDSATKAQQEAVRSGQESGCAKSGRADHPAGAGGGPRDGGGY